MKKGLLAIGLVFFGFVMANYLLIQMDSFLSAQAPSAAAAEGKTFYDDVPVIDFSFFTPTGQGAITITQGYGDTPYADLYGDHWHDGVDIDATYGEPIYAATAGTVIATGDQDKYCYHRGFGKYVAVNDPTDGLVLWYAHLGAITVSPGMTIARGTEIGTVGATGYETGVHLHFSIFAANGFSMKSRNGCGPDPTGQDEDPIPFLERLAG
jgi:murein DD-endopeptidase MepM/ murein hydrolase activator NlpD